MESPNVLIVEDDKQLCSALTDTLSMKGYKCLAADNGMDAFQVIQEQNIDLIISDVNMPRLDGFGLLEKIQSYDPTIPIMLITAYGTVEKAVDAIKNGASDYLKKPFESHQLLEKVEKYLPTTDTFFSFIVNDPKSVRLFNLAKRVSETDSTVLIMGESGTGKEILAQYIHNLSDRRKNNFVAINCAAIPDNMLEAILFGHEKGAFTGAYQSRPGKFELANGGTILLDEISEMPLALQSKLLRVLQENEVDRVGGKSPIQLDVRVIATTNRKLNQYVAEGKFREDLFYRLNVFPLNSLPLRQRKLDILPLAEFFCNKYIKKFRQKKANYIIDDRSQEKLLNYTWPGNVRELENVMQRAIVLTNSNVITAQSVYFETDIESTGMDLNDLEEENKDLQEGLIQHEYNLVSEVLENCNGNRRDAANKLGISVKDLKVKISKMKTMGFDLA